MLEEVKAYIKVTWDEEDLFIDSLIQSGKGYLDTVTGYSLDYEYMQNKDLIKDFVRYSYNNQSEYFEENFKSHIIRTQFNAVLGIGIKNEKNKI